MTTHAERPSPGRPFVPAGAILTASGRQALALVAQHLRARGINEILAPAYRCPTMLEPFQLEGIHVTLVPVGEDLLLHPTAVTAALRSRHHDDGARVRLDDAARPSLTSVSLDDDDGAARSAGHPRPCAILHSETFGNRAGPELAAVLAGARAAGYVVVVDETHSFLDASHAPGGHAPGDYHVASLRKWLPLADGAYVAGIPDVELSRRPCDEAVTAAGLRALHAEANSQRDDPGALWERAEELVDAATQPAAMSPESRALLATMDAESFVQARAAAAARLRAVLTDAGVEVLNRAACFVAVRVPIRDAARIVQELAAAGINEPLRWDRPKGLSPEAAWPAGILTLPLDARAAEAVRHVAAPESTPV